jgi:hypothetical protein
MAAKSLESAEFGITGEPGNARRSGEAAAKFFCDFPAGCGHITVKHER